MAAARAAGDGSRAAAGRAAPRRTRVTRQIAPVVTGPPRPAALTAGTARLRPGFDRRRRAAGGPASAGLAPVRDAGPAAGPGRRGRRDRPRPRTAAAAAGHHPARRRPAVRTGRAGRVPAHRPARRRVPARSSLPLDIGAATKTVPAAPAPRRHHAGPALRLPRLPPAPRRLPGPPHPPPTDGGAHQPDQPAPAVRLPPPHRHPPLGLDHHPQRRRHHHRHQPRQTTHPATATDHPPASPDPGGHAGRVRVSRPDYAPGSSSASSRSRRNLAHNWQIGAPVKRSLIAYDH